MSGVLDAVASITSRLGRRKPGEVGPSAETMGDIQRVLSMRPGDARPLNQSDFRNVASRFKLDPAALHTIAEKESGEEGGFTRDGRITMLDEPHYFSRLTKKRFDKSHPHLSYPNAIKRSQAHRLSPEWVTAWGRHPYQLTRVQRWQLWAWQAELDFNAALQSISIGRFQVMGAHWSAMEFESPLAMLEFAYESEANHLDLCVRWFQINGRLDDLRRCDWGQIAYYNGSGNLREYADQCRAIFARKQRLYAGG